jgi:hypothetical protein
MNNFPAFFLQSFSSFCIIGNVAVYFFEPPVSSCFGNNKVFTIFMAMPETALPTGRQACTKITVLYFGKTISGLPSRLLSWSLKRNPLACKNFLTSISGFVFLPFICCILKLRCSGVCTCLPAGRRLPYQSTNVASFSFWRSLQGREDEVGRCQQVCTKLFCLAIILSPKIQNQNLDFQGYSLKKIPPVSCIRREVNCKCCLIILGVAYAMNTKLSFRSLQDCHLHN